MGQDFSKKTQMIQPPHSTIQPEGATHYINSQFYKLGRFGFVYRWDEHMDEWRRSYLDKADLKRNRSILENRSVA